MTKRIELGRADFLTVCGVCTDIECDGERPAMCVSERKYYKQERKIAFKSKERNIRTNLNVSGLN